MTEYTPGGRSKITRATFPSDFIGGTCAVDPTTGDVAIPGSTNGRTTEGAVAVYTSLYGSRGDLRRLGRRRVALDEMHVLESNRLGAPGSSDVRSSSEATISFLDCQIDEIDAQIRSLIDDDLTLRGKRELLMSIPGIGERLAVTTLCELPNISEFRSAKALSSFTGLCPREFRSGKSVSASWLSKTGNAHLRRMLHMPAVAAIRFNPILKDFAKRLRSSGKHGKQIVAAVMRRLLVLAYGVLKSGHPFDPEIGCGRHHGRTPSLSPVLSP